MKKENIFMAIWRLVRDSWDGFQDNKAFKLSASLAYYTIFSLSPMLIVIISMCGLFYGKAAIEGRIYEQINEVVGSQAAMEIQESIKAISLSGNSLWASIIGIITFFIGATGVFTEIQDSINLIWRIRAKPKLSVVKYLLNRLLSFSLIVGIGFLLVVSLVINAVLVGFSEDISHYFPQITKGLIHLIDLGTTFTVITILFSVIFKVLPDARIRWKDALVGALVTAVLFLLGKLGISYYIGRKNMGVVYGAAGSIIVILLWVYYSAIILYYGAEFTKLFADRYGKKIRPSKYAVMIHQREVTIDG